MTDTPRIVPCPTCQNPTQWSARNTFRPFCSERCRLIDLGAWADERHRIAGDEAHADVNSEDLQ